MLSQKPFGTIDQPQVSGTKIDHKIQDIDRNLKQKELSQRNDPRKALYLHLRATFGTHSSSLFRIMQSLEKISIKENSYAARLAAWKLGADNVALVLGKTIHLHNISKDCFLNDHRLVRHEMKHIEQFARHGSAWFICLYLLEWMKHGYTNNRFEIEARAAENAP